MGGDRGHGGLTTFELADVAGTAIQAELTPKNIKIELGGDSECETFIKCLLFAANELERQLEINSNNKG